MPRLFDLRASLFSLNCFVAAVGALFIALAIGLPRPYWAMATVYIVSQPLSGAVRSKAVYRLIGTLIGGAAAVALVPNLVDSPVLLSLAIALWVGGCLTVSLLDRTPRSYVVMLAGYTCAIIGFSSVGQPQQIFDTAVSRVVEIGLGILCATAAHSFIFPQPVGAVLRTRVRDWLVDADCWLTDLAKGDDPAADRRHLAGAATEIRLLATHLPFDTSHLNSAGGAVQAIHDRMMLLIPLLSGVGDRVAALGDNVPGDIRALLAAAGRWVEGGAGEEAGRALSADLRRQAAERPGALWADLLCDSLLVRLAEAVEALTEAHALQARLADPYAPLRPDTAQAMARAVARPLPGDPAMALLSGVGAVLATLIACAVWILTGWPDGGVAAMMAAVFCAMFAALDDPAPAIADFGVYTLAGLGLAFVYIVAILPAIDGFPLLVVSLAPTLFVLGAVMAKPKYAIKGLAAALGFTASLLLQDRFVPDVEGFLNANLAQLTGVLTAIAVTRMLRSAGVEAGVARLSRRTSAAIGRLARQGSGEDPAGFAALLVDRIAQLTPKLARRDDGVAAGAALRDLRVAMNLMTLQQARAALGPDAQAFVDRVGQDLARHYARAPSQDTRPPDGLLGPLDAAIGGLAGRRAAGDRDALLGLVGLRRNLFPSAPSFEAGR